MNKKQLAVAIGVALASSLLFVAIANAVTTAYAPVPRYDSSLAIPLGQTQTSTMTMVSGVDGNGETLTGPMCFTLDTGNSGLVEDVCGTASGTVVSNLVRGVDSSGFNASTTLDRAHRVGADVRITDSPYLVQYYELLSGLQSFPNALSYSSHPISTASTTIEDKSYIDSATVYGGVPALSTVPGLIFAASATQVTNGTATGTYGPNPYFYAITPSAVATTSRASAIPLTNASGTIDPSFVSGTAYTFNNPTFTGLVIGAVPAGSIEAYVSSTAPNGWLLCNGQTVATSSYPNLFALIGYGYGGSTSTFGLPNMGGRFIAGPSSTLSSTIGAVGGATSSVYGGLSIPTNGTWNNSGGPSNSLTNGGSTGTSTVSTVPPYIIENYIIKY